MFARNFGIPDAAAAGARNNLTASTPRLFSCSGDCSFLVTINADLANLSAELILICPHCRQMNFFETGADLCRHLRSEHSRRRPYECNWPGCTQSDLLRSDIRRHLVQAHRRSLVNELAEAVVRTNRRALNLEKRMLQDWFSSTDYTDLAIAEALQRIEDADV